MKISYSQLLLCGVLCVGLSAPVHADDKDVRIDALEQQLLLIMDELKALKSERQIEKTAQSNVQSELQRQVDTLKVTTSNLSIKQDEKSVSLPDDVKITFNPSPKISSGDFTWEPTGRIHYDVGFFDDDAVDQPNGATFRRARIGSKGKISKNFGYSFDFELAGEDLDTRDTFISYTGIENTIVKLGNFKPGLGLEELASSNDVTFIERATPTTSFVTGQILGFGFVTHGDNWFASAGVFNDEPGTESQDDEAFSLSARLAALPVFEEDRLVHLGASILYLEPDGEDTTFDFDANAENDLQAVDSVSAVITDAQNATIYGLEAAALYGPFSLQGEYFFNQIENDAGNDPLFDGGYVQASWILTGESRNYTLTRGAFNNPKPRRPFDLTKKGHWGAFELAARFSHLNLNDGGIDGGQINNVTLGANWYVNNYTRFLANVIFVNTDDNAVNPNDDPNIFLFRSQVNF